MFDKIEKMPPHKKFLLSLAVILFTFILPISGSITIFVLFFSSIPLGEYLGETLTEEDFTIIINEEDVEDEIKENF